MFWCLARRYRRGLTSHIPEVMGNARGRMGAMRPAIFRTLYVLIASPPC
jgi:hypothetical protein